jgi:hypothetical protein
MFKVLVRQRLYQLSDKQAECPLKLAKMRCDDRVRR